MFRVLDQDGDGYITKSDLRDIISRMGQKLTEPDMEEMITEADMDGDNQINFEGQIFINSEVDKLKVIKLVIKILDSFKQKQKQFNFLSINKNSSEFNLTPSFKHLFIMFFPEFVKIVLSR